MLSVLPTKSEQQRQQKDLTQFNPEQTEQMELLSCVVLRKLERLEKGQLAELRKTQRERSGKGRRQLQCKLQTRSSFGRDCASSCFTAQSGYSCTIEKEHGGKKVIDKIVWKILSSLPFSPLIFNSIKDNVETLYKTVQMPTVIRSNSTRLENMGTFKLHTVLQP